MPKRTAVKTYLAPGLVRPFAMDCKALGDLERLGVQIPQNALRDLYGVYGSSLGAHGMDAAPGMITPANAGVPLQFLQHFLPGLVRTVTAARKIDQLAGRAIAGKWSDEEIVQTIIEHTGQARPYGDTTAVPLAEFNVTFERRTIVRFEEGFETAILEDARASEIKIAPGTEKRAAVATALGIEQNRVGFYGYNDGENRTYGFLNDPNLPAYQNLPAGAGGSSMFSAKTFAEITGDLRILFSALRVNSGELIDPEKDAMTLALAPSARESLSITNDQGSMSVRQWLKENYPKLRIESAPDLENANGGASVLYLWADAVQGMGEEGDQRTLDQYVPEVLRLLGVEKRAKGALEAYSNATAGCLWRMPFAVVRYSGV